MTNTLFVMFSVRINGKGKYAHLPESVGLLRACGVG